MPTLSELIDQLGGFVATAYKAKVSVQTVYTWKKLGKVVYAAPAIRLARAAQAEGINVTIEHLAGEPVETPVAPTPLRRGARVRRASTCSPIPLVRKSTSAATAVHARAASSAYASVVGF